MPPHFLLSKRDRIPSPDVTLVRIVVIFSALLLWVVVEGPVNVGLAHLFDWLDLR